MGKNPSSASASGTTSASGTASASASGIASGTTASASASGIASGTASGTTHHQKSQFRYLFMLKNYTYSIWVRLVSGEGVMVCLVYTCRNTKLHL